MYWSHQSSMGPFNVSNATSTYYLHSWHEIEKIILHANKKYPSSCNICLTTHHGWTLSTTRIHSKMFSLIPFLIVSTSACPISCANRNVFSSITMNGVAFNGFVFSMLQIATTIVSTWCLWCVHQNDGIIVCKSGTVLMMWYIGCHPQVVCSMQGTIVCS